MRHRKAGKHLGRSASHRKAMWRNMAASLFQHGAIRTTEVKAKQLRRFAERLITIAKKGDLHARRRIIQLMQDRDMYTYDKTANDFVPEEKTVVQKLFDEIAPRFSERSGGYTRIIRVAERRIGDGGAQVILQLVEEGAGSGKSGGSSRRKAITAGRVEALKKAGLLGGKKAKAQVEEEPQADDQDEAAEVAEEPQDEAADAEAQEDAADAQETQAEEDKAE